MRQYEITWKTRLEGPDDPEEAKEFFQNIANQIAVRPDILDVQVIPRGYEAQSEDEEDAIQAGEIDGED